MTPNVCVFDPPFEGDLPNPTPDGHRSYRPPGANPAVISINRDRPRDFGDCRQPLEVGCRITVARRRIVAIGRCAGVAVGGGRISVGGSCISVGGGAIAGGIAVGGSAIGGARRIPISGPTATTALRSRTVPGSSVTIGGRNGAGGTHPPAVTYWPAVACWRSIAPRRRSVTNCPARRVASVAPSISMGPGTALDPIGWRCHVTIAGVSEGAAVTIAARAGGRLRSEAGHRAERERHPDCDVSKHQPSPHRFNV